MLNSSLEFSQALGSTTRMRSVRCKKSCPWQGRKESSPLGNRISIKDTVRVASSSSRCRVKSRKPSAMDDRVSRRSRTRKLNLEAKSPVHLSYKNTFKSIPLSIQTYFDVQRRSCLVIAIQDSIIVPKM